VEKPNNSDFLYEKGMCNISDRAGVAIGLLKAYSQGPVQKTGQTVKRAAQVTGQTLSNGVRKTGETISHGAKATGRTVRKAVDKTGDSIRNIGSNQNM
jgi:hypothetical protein